MQHLSLRMRLTLWYTVALVAAICLFGADVLWGERRLGLRRVDAELDSVVSAVTHALGEQLDAEASVQAAASRARAAAALPGATVSILDAAGRPLAGDDRVAEHVEDLRSVEGRVVSTVPGPAGEWRLHADRRRFGDVTLFVLAAQPLTDVRRAQHEVLEAMEVAIPLVLLIAGGGGYWLASLGLRPITDMANRAAQMAPTGVDDLGDAARRDELGQFARAFNGLVARLRASLSTQRQFMADASHELRTPVSVIRAAADVTLSRDHRDEAEYREALTITGGQARHLGRLVEQMLVLARADAGGYSLRLTNLYLDDAIEDCRRAAEVMAIERGVPVTFGPIGELPIRGDEALLRQLILNVLNNAVQHTPAGGRVTVTVERAAGSVHIRVADTGAGIALGDQLRIFERFVQLDPARRRTGAGLGLPIARWIAEAHGGSLELEQSGPSGSTFRITLPT